MSIVGYGLDKGGMSTLRQLVAWWRRQPRSVTGGGGPTFPPLPQSKSVTFRNDSGETIPAFSVVKITDSVDNRARPCLIAEQPDNGFAQHYAVTAERDVAANDYGQCYTGGWVRVKYKDGAEPICGESYGTTPGYWTASADYPCCLDVYGVTDSTNGIMVANLHPVKPLPVVLNVSALLTDPGSGLSGRWCSEAYPGTGEISSTPIAGSAAAAGIEILSVSSHGDRCVKLLIPGMWRAILWMSSAKPSSQSNPTDVEQDTGSDGDPAHTHTYDKTGLGFPVMTTTAWAHLYNAAGDTVTTNAGNIGCQVPFFINTGPPDGCISPPNCHTRVFESLADQEILLEVQPRGYNTADPQPSVEVFMNYTLEWLGPTPT